MKRGQKSQEFYERAKKVMPYGVNSNFRYWGEDKSPVVADARDAYIYDFDGNRYIDYRLGFGPVILGHNDPFVTQRVVEAIQHGVTFAATQEYEVKVAEHIIAMCPGVEMVRLANTGTECTMHAIRLARGYTGRDLILKFEGSYHGFQDYLLWSTANSKTEGMGDRSRPTAVKQSLGIPEILRELLVIAPWNDVEVLDDILKEKGDQIAAIIVEPIMGNAAAMIPQHGYLEFLRQKCSEYGIVLIFDEVKTGFRIAAGGAREYFGVIPDISTYAKAMGNGYPIAAIAGKREIMMTIAPGKVAQGGTYTGNAVATSAADATLEFMRSGQVFPQIQKVGTILMNGIGEILTRHNVPHRIHGVPAMFGITLSDFNPRDFRDLDKVDWDLYEVIGEHLIDNGVMPDPDGREPWFLCSDHTEADAAETLQKFEDAVQYALQHHH
jgi:glutamate-1-semialdehyde 2,1-aminomutase